MVDGPKRIEWPKNLDRIRRAQEHAAAIREIELEQHGSFPDAELVGPDVVSAREQRWSWVCPERFVNARLADVDEVVRAAFQGFVDRPDGRTLAIAGAVGCGKTYAALAAARELHMASRDVMFWPVVELWRKLRPGGPEDLIDAVSDVDVLVLDDLGSERATEWSAEQMWEIVNHRWIAKRSTIFTTNFPWLTLKETIGARVYDRVVNAETVRVVLDGGSRRRG